MSTKDAADSWLLYRCALCGDVFRTSMYGRITLLLPCLCETRAPRRTESTDPVDAMKEFSAELLARQAASEDEP